MSETKNDDMEAAKANHTEVKAAYKKFLKANDLKEGEDSDDPKIAKKLKTHLKAVKEAEAAIKAAKKAGKPAKAERVSSYDYPADCVTAEDKKKFRTKARAAAKKGEKAAKKDAKAADKAASKKGGKAEAAPAAPAKKKKAKSED